MLTMKPSSQTDESGDAASNAEQAAKTISWRGEHIAAMQEALLSAFDLAGLKQLALTRLDVPLAHIVNGVDSRRFTEVTLDLAEWAANNEAVGLHGLLAACLQESPKQPKFTALAKQWAGVIFDTKPPKCPYPGMAPFQLESRFPFYGRSAEINEAVQQLRLYPFLTVIGASGSGKSSLVFAGVVPAMQKSSFFDDNLQAVAKRPGHKPMAALAEAVRIQAAAPLVLIIDQFEETFTGSPREEAVAFSAALLHLIGAPNLYVILTVRADFYPELMNLPLWDRIKAHRLEVTTLRGDGLQEAIEQPAVDAGVTIEPSLVQKLMADAGNEPGVLPFLQETLVLLWEGLARRTLTLDAYEQLTDADGRSGLQIAMGRRADQAYGELTDDGKVLAQRIFLRLVQFGEGRPDTRRQLAETDLRTADDNAALFGAVLAQLIDRRLLTVDNPDAGAARKVDVAHEALITGWKRLDTWVKDRRTAEQARRRLEAKAGEWVRLGSGQGGLLDRLQLKEADAYLASPDGKLLGVSTQTSAFIAASRKDADPGWNTLGTALLVFAAFAVAALFAAALFHVQTNLLSVPARVALLALWAAMVIGVLGMLWALRRSEPHFLKHWSHNIVTGPLWSGVCGLIIAAACGIWIYTAASMLPLEQQCAEMGFGRGDIAGQIAVIGDDADPFNATLFAGLIKRISNKSAVGLLASKENAQKCRSFFEHAVAVGTAKAPDGSFLIHVDEIDLRTGTRTQLTTGVTTAGDCREYVELAAKVVTSFGFSKPLHDAALFSVSGYSCQAALFNEMGVEAGINADFATAERRFREALAIQPNFVDARVNLGWALYKTGRAAQGVDQIRQAKRLLPLASYTVESHLGMACYLANDMACARDALIQALVLNDDEEVQVGRLHELFQVYRYSGALKEAEQVLGKLAEHLAALQPHRKHNDILLPFDQGILAFARGQWHEAMNYLQAADGYQNFDIVDWAKIAFIAVVDKDQSDVVRSAYRAWDEEITYLLAKTAEKLNDPGAACRYLARYAATPSTSIYGEADRRADAQKMAATLDCGNR